MSDTAFTFNADEEIANDPSLIATSAPPGEYTVVLTEAKKEEISGGKGHRMSLTFTVTEGPYQGQRVYENLSLWFTGPEKTPGMVAKIAKGKLVRLCKALGQPSFTDFTQLYNKPLRLVTEAKQGKPKQVVVEGVPTMQPGKTFINVTQYKSLTDTKVQVTVEQPSQPVVQQQVTNQVPGVPPQPVVQAPQAAVPSSNTPPIPG